MSLSEPNTAPATRAATFATRLEQFGDAIAVISDVGEKITYLELAARADALAEQLGAERRLLLIEAGNELPALIAYLGALRNGHPVLLTSADGGSMSERIAATYRPDARFHKQDGEWVIERQPPRPRNLHPDLALLLSTSGSTGAAKLVRLSYEAAEANARSIGEYLDLRPDDRAITTLPIHYSYGLSVVNSHLAAGATLVLTGRSVIDDEFWRLVEAQGVTSLAGVPYTYDLFERIGLRGKTIASLRTMTQAGGRLPSELARLYAEWARNSGIRFFVMYGQTEATARMAYMPPDRLLDHPGCIGVAIPSGAFRLVDEDGGEVDGVDVAGELVYSGPNVMLGYALEESDFAKGRELHELSTGDLAARNADGLYYIVGRKSRFSKLFGLRISLDEVEATLARQGVRAVVAGDDSLIAIAATDVDAEVVINDLSTTFDLPASVFAVMNFAEIPVLSSGKFDYRTILERGKQKAQAAEAAEATDNKRDGTVQSAFRHAFPRADIGPSESFISLGGDSLSYVRLSLEIEERLGFLPERWEDLSIAELDSLAQRGNRKARHLWSLRAIESEIVIRASAITAVVINHASALTVGGGAHVLLMLSGYNFSRYQRTRLVEGQGWSVLRSFLQRIIAPYYIILLAYFLLERKLDIPSLFLVSNFFGRSGSFLEPYWFLETLLQSMIIFVALFALPRVRRAAARDPWTFGLVLLASALAVRICTFAVFQHHWLQERTPDTIFYVMALGWCLHQATTRARKLVLTGVITAIVALQITGVEGLWDRFAYPSNLSHASWFAVAAGLIMWAPRIVLPNAVHTTVGVIAAASFYIYLTHGVPVYLLLQVMHVDSLAISLPLSLAIGVLAYLLSQRIAHTQEN